jgi:hypothetical protein
MLPNKKNKVFEIILNVIFSILSLVFGAYFIICAIFNLSYSGTFVYIGSIILLTMYLFWIILLIELKDVTIFSLISVFAFLFSIQFFTLSNGSHYMLYLHNFAVVGVIVTFLNYKLNKAFIKYIGLLYLFILLLLVLLLNNLKFHIQYFDLYSIILFAVSSVFIYFISESLKKEKSIKPTLYILSIYPVIHFILYIVIGHLIFNIN